MPARDARWRVVDGVADAFALARPSAGAEARAPRATLWTEPDEEPLPNRAATVREAFPVRGRARGTASARSRRRRRRSAREASTWCSRARRALDENPLVVDAYARASASGNV